VVLADIQLTLDGRSFIMLVWDPHGNSMAMYSVAVEPPSAQGTQPKQLQYAWTRRDVRLTVTPAMIFVYSPVEIWGVPVNFNAGQQASSMYAPATVTRISSLAFAFVPGQDCKFTEWQRLTPCSRTCNGGFRKEARTILSQPAKGGSACPDISREVPCNEQPCPQDCKLSPWKSEESCSKPCDGGLKKQTRQVLQAAAHAGVACPALKRSVACNTHPCNGHDCILTPWLNDGTCSKTCGTGRLKQYRTVVSKEEYGGKPCNASRSHRVVLCNPTACGGERTFDPVTSGRLSGFDFGVQEYCEQPQLCSVLSAVEVRRIMLDGAHDRSSLDKTGTKDISSPTLGAARTVVLLGSSLLLLAAFLALSLRFRRLRLLETSSWSDSEI